MKKQENRNHRAIDERDEQLQNQNQDDIRENKQPVPQPKDFEDIEY
ncbi:hypothetical protein [Alkalihalobacterium chitinilyticum]|uniref:3-methyladenine DNA glycosylase n=1 Tax=Alkalihalobacterium chitinilyticum TaxID=2980103 RepID=A0ABT5VDD6_9BACI|nr:hypothetical protein [Alkalihalobacterium chitinilyticum]MDE5413467.1 hypothetical protein [Alkalihalobacterium chitinilyticum]